MSTEPAGQGHQDSGKRDVPAVFAESGLEKEGLERIADDDGPASELAAALLRCYY